MYFRILIMVALAGCSSNGNGAKADAGVDAYFSKCGHPGDPGNELGIGKFCGQLSDCNSTPAAPLCSSLGDPQTHFCTKTCQMGGPANQCGTATMCACNGGGQCGCTPSACLGP